MYGLGWYNRKGKIVKVVQPKSERRDGTESKLDNTLDFADIYECFEEEDDIEQPQSHYLQLSYRQNINISTILESVGNA